MQNIYAMKVKLILLRISERDENIKILDHYCIIKLDSMITLREMTI